MTNEELDKLDKLAATEVMGWIIHEEADWAHWRDNTELRYFVYDWNPTRNIAQAWELLEKFLHLNPLLDYDHDSEKWTCDLVGIPRLTVSAGAVPLAITLACLKAKGVEV